jgi:hypothetical protein
MTEPLPAKPIEQPDSRRSLRDAISGMWDNEYSRPFVAGACNCDECCDNVAEAVLKLPEIQALLRAGRAWTDVASHDAFMQSPDFAKNVLAMPSEVFQQEGPEND